MGVPLRKIYQQAVDLSQEDRELLTDLLLDTLAAPLDPVIEAAWRPELDRRADELENGVVKGVPWPEVYERLKARLLPRASSSIPNWISNTVTADVQIASEG